jgi:hypothetical protein
MSSAQRASLYLRAAGRSLRSAPISLASFGPLDERPVFVLGSPRSGTTFLAGALGSLPGFVDLGEVHPLKASIAELAALDAEPAARRIRRILGVTRRLGLVGSRRAVEQTPETAFVLRAVAHAFPRATLVHVLRDGRDVVCSLLERGWLRRDRSGGDDVGARYGRHARFWVEPGREREFAEAGDVRRAAWAWRRYVESARTAGVHLVEVRYELLAGEPAAAAAELARALAVEPDAVAAALGAAHSASVGRHRRDLDAAGLAEVELEAGALLAELGYLGATRARGA